VCSSDLVPVVNDLSAIVVLVNPNRMRPPIAPVALDYLAAALEARGHRPVLLDLCWPEDWRAEIAAFFAKARPDLIGFSIRNLDDCYMASQQHFGPLYREMLEAIRSASTAPVVLGGVGFSVMPEAMLDLLGADYGVAGDGEQALAEIADCVAAGRDLHDVPGLLWRGDGGWLANPRMPVPGEAVPTRRRFVDNARYFTEGGQGGVETLNRPAVVESAKEQCVTDVLKQLVRNQMIQDRKHLFLT
jgi:radical SAM superfamily enzyme YgiQ (UPF0313 family)